MGPLKASDLLAERILDAQFSGQPLHKFLIGLDTSEKASQAAEKNYPNYQSALKKHSYLDSATEKIIKFATFAVIGTIPAVILFIAVNSVTVGLAGFALLPVISGIAGAIFFGKSDPEKFENEVALIAATNFNVMRLARLKGKIDSLNGKLKRLKKKRKTRPYQLTLARDYFAELYNAHSRGSATTETKKTVTPPSQQQQQQQQPHLPLNRPIVPPLSMPPLILPGNKNNPGGKKSLGRSN